MPGWRFVGALLPSCLLGFLWRLIAMGGSSLCAAGLLGVYVMWCLWSFLLEVGFFGGRIWGMCGCDGRSLRGESLASGASLLEMSCCTCPLTAGCSPGNSCLGWDVLRPSCVLFWWAGCVWVVVAWLLWSASGGVPWMCGQCGAHMVWVGVFSLCGCDMMSELPFRIYSYNFVSCISLTILRTLLIEALFFPSSFLGCSFRGFSGAMSLIFLKLSFSHSLLIFFVRLLAVLFYSDYYVCYSLKVFFLFFAGLHKFSCDKILFQQNLYSNYVALSVAYL